MRTLVTGGAGFLGSHLCDALLQDGHDLTILDNFSSGRTTNIANILDKDHNIRLVKGDCKNPRDVKKSLKNAGIVFHFSANPEVRMDRSDSNTCFRENVLATQVLLEQIKDSEVEKIVFASSSTVYGEAKMTPTPEDYGPLEPISIYGGSKLSSEGLVSAYCHIYGKTGVILRFANITGPRSQHGVARDFVKQARNNSGKLVILGDGHQKKSYLYIDDCIEGIVKATDAARPGINVFNVGSLDQIDVLQVADVVMKEMGQTGVTYEFREGGRGGTGWNGDVKNMLLDVSKLMSKGWKPRYSSTEAVRLTVRSALGLESKPTVSGPMIMRR